MLALILIRTIVATAILAIAISVRLAPHGFLISTQLFSSLLLSVYLTSAAFLLIWRFARRHALLLYLQLAFDLIFVSALVYFTGIVDSLFTPLYLLVIVYASIVQQRDGGVVAATASSIFYVGMIELAYVGVLPQRLDGVHLTTLYYMVFLNVLAFASVAYLGVHLSERLKRTRIELEAQQSSLADLRALNQDIVESIRTGLLTVDLNGKIIMLNRAATEITGYRPEDVADDTALQVLGYDFWQRIQATDFSKEKHALRHDGWRKTRDGSDMYLGLSVSPLNDHKGQHIGYIVSFQDLTEIKKLEEEIQLKEKMAAVGQMAAGIAHEIRNPLASIHGSVQLLKDTLQLNDERTKLMSIILRESDRLNKIVSDFLAYAKPQKRQQQLVNVRALISEMVSLLRQSSEFKPNHCIDTSLVGNNCELWGDASQIRQIFWNLATNALKAMPDGGKLSITAAQDHNGHVRIVFADTGIGMTDEEMSKVFQPFYSRFPGGVGLGMAIVYQIVTSHCGKISLHSSKGAGTTVVLDFPAPESLKGQTDKSP